MSACCITSPAPRVRNAAALTGLYQALGDTTRLRILAILAPAGAGPGGELCVCHIHDSLGVSQPTASRHLAYLKKAGLVTARREGVWMHHRLCVRRTRCLRRSSTPRCMHRARRQHGRATTRGCTRGRPVGLGPIRARAVSVPHYNGARHAPPPPLPSAWPAGGCSSCSSSR